MDSKLTLPLEPLISLFQCYWVVFLSKSKIYKFFLEWIDEEIVVGNLPILHLEGVFNDSDKLLVVDTFISKKQSLETKVSLND